MDDAIIKKLLPIAVGVVATMAGAIAFDPQGVGELKMSIQRLENDVVNCNEQKLMAVDKLTAIHQTAMDRCMLELDRSHKQLDRCLERLSRTDPDAVDAYYTFGSLP